MRHALEPPNQRELVARLEAPRLAAKHALGVVLEALGPLGAPGLDPDLERPAHAAVDDDLLPGSQQRQEPRVLAPEGALGVLEEVGVAFRRDHGEADGTNGPLHIVPELLALDLLVERDGDGPLDALLFEL